MPQELQRIAYAARARRAALLDYLRDATVDPADEEPEIRRRFYLTIPGRMSWLPIWAEGIDEALLRAREEGAVAVFDDRPELIWRRPAGRQLAGDRQEG